LEQNCEIFLGSNVIGMAIIAKEGLYYRFDCRCRFREKGVYRLSAQSDDGLVDLGICIPREDAFGLCTKIPVSRLGEGRIRIFVKNKEDAKHVIPIFQDRPFCQLDKLDKAVFCDGGILIKG